MTTLSNPVASPLASVAVIIPAYNYAHYLPRAIQSALNQEYPNCEIIVVDDGSTDNTAEVVKSFGDRVRYVHQKNAGLPAARNTGIRVAGTEFIGFLDADDEWQPGFLQASLKAFAELPKEFALVACQAVLVGENSEPLKLKHLLPKRSREITCAELILKNRFSPSSVVARRTALVDCGLFDESLRSSEDRDMWIRIAAYHRVHLQCERLVLIRRHSSNMSLHADRMKANIAKVLHKAWEHGLVSRTNYVFWLRVRAFYFFQTAWMFWDAGRRREACRDMTFSLLLWPWFPATHDLNEPALFRIRSLRRFLLSENPKIRPPSGPDATLQPAVKSSAT